MSNLNSRLNRLEEKLVPKPKNPIYVVWNDDEMSAEEERRIKAEHPSALIIRIRWTK